jgi:hypothetical protein
MTVNGTSAADQRPATSAGGRVDWVDYAKGICIVMVVMMHSVLGVEAAADQTGFMHALVAFAKRRWRAPEAFGGELLAIRPSPQRESSASSSEPAKSHASICEMMFNEPVTHVSERCYPCPRAVHSTGRPSTPRHLDLFTEFSGIPGHPLSRVMTSDIAVE